MLEFIGFLFSNPWTGIPIGGIIVLGILIALNAIFDDYY